MSSLWNRSGTIERYADDLRATGAKAYFFLGGTTTPMSVYQDSGESAAHSHPVVADAYGRWPDVFVPYVTSYDVRVTSADNVQLTYTLEIPNPDPIDLSVTIDPEESVQTGMIHVELVNTTKAGYVRLNGRTIGTAASGATERANGTPGPGNNDTEDLFVYLWNNLSDAAAPVSGGRGGSAAADFAANKTIVLPSFQGAVPLGLDDMGATAGGFFTGLTFSVGSAILAGSRTGGNGVTLLSANLPAHSHSGTTAAEGAHTHTGTTGVESVDHTHSGTTGAEAAHTHSFSGTSSSDGDHTHLLFDNVNTASPLIAGEPASLSNTAGGDNSYSITGIAGTPDLGVSSSDGAHTHTTAGTTGAGSSHTHSFTSAGVSITHTHSFTTSAGSAHSHTFTTDSIGASDPFNNLPRSVLVTWYIKL